MMTAELFRAAAFFAHRSLFRAAEHDRRLIDVNMLSATELKWLNDYHERVNRAVRPHLDDNATKLWLDEATAAMLPL